MKHLDSAGLKRIKDVHRKHKEAIEDGNYHKRIMRDMEFHMCLASLPNCQIQQNMLQELFDVLLLRYSQNLYFYSLMETSYSEHSEILHCLEKNDEEGVKKAMTSHLTSVRDHIAERMSKLIIDTKDSLYKEYFS